MSFLHSALDVLCSDNYVLSDIKPSAWAEKRRIMSSEVTSSPGPFTYDRTPYLIEPVNCLSPDHPARRVAVMKSSQIGFSTGVIENGIGWIISENPGPIFLLTGSMDLTKQSMDTKIDQMIDSCGLRHFIRPNVMRAKNQRTGDTSTSKEFPGGRLQTGQTGNHTKLRQISMQYGFVDDFEAAPAASKQSGSTTTLIEARFDSYYTKMKLFYISTPEIKHTSNIEPQFLNGDQRYYHVPCPCCGDMIVLTWSIKIDKDVTGIYYKLDKSNKLIASSVGYVCQSCGEFFDDSHKYEMNLNGHWIPSAEPIDPTYYSYHINSLYAPPGTYDWEYYVRDYLKACPPNQPIKYMLYKTFHNLVLGLPWEERGEKPNANQLSLNTRPYEVGIVPSALSENDGNGEIVMITCACDLNGTVEDARVDYEIVAWSRSGVSYSVEHGSIGTFIPRENTLKKKVDRQRWTYEHGVANSVWPEFFKVMTKTYSDDKGQPMQVTITGVDTGHYTNYANKFLDYCIEQQRYCVGLKGTGNEKYRMVDKDTRAFRPARERANLYLVEVNQIKDEISESVKLKWDDRTGVQQPVGFMNFPTPGKNQYTMRSYFSHFESEHKILKENTEGQVTGSLWIKRNAAVMNHFWDVKVYNTALKEIFMWAMCEEFKVKYPNWKTYCDIVTGNI